MKNTDENTRKETIEYIIFYSLFLFFGWNSALRIVHGLFCNKNISSSSGFGMKWFLDFMMYKVGSMLRNVVLIGCIG